MQRRAFLTGALLGSFVPLARAHGEKRDSTSAANDEAPYGHPGNVVDVSRTVAVTMSDDMKFRPSSVTVRRGETIRFLVTNAGQVRHEMTIGTLKELQEHAELMRRFPKMKHVEPNQVALEPGEKGEIVWKFSRAGAIDFACLQPGHFEAGMRGTLSVK